MIHDKLLTLEQATNEINAKLKRPAYDPKSLIKHIAAVRERLLICKPFVDLVICPIHTPSKKLFIFEGCFRLVDSDQCMAIDAVIGGALSGSTSFGIEHFKVDSRIKNKTENGFDSLNTYASDGEYAIIRYDDFADSAVEAVGMYNDQETNKYRLPKTLRVKPFNPHIDEIYVLEKELREFIRVVLDDRTTTVSELAVQPKQTEKEKPKKPKKAVKPETQRRYEEMQKRVNEVANSNKYLSHAGVCARIAHEFNCAPDTIRRNTKLIRD